MSIRKQNKNERKIEVKERGKKTLFLWCGILTASWMILSIVFQLNFPVGIEGMWNGFFIIYLYVRLKMEEATKR